MCASAIWMRGRPLGGIYDFKGSPTLSLCGSRV
jgi:hypothetical protein